MRRKNLAKRRRERKLEGCGGQRLSVAWWIRCLQHGQVQKLALPQLRSSGRAKTSSLVKPQQWQISVKQCWVQQSHVVWDQPRPFCLLIQWKCCRSTAPEPSRRWFLGERHYLLSRSFQQLSERATWPFTGIFCLKMLEGFFPTPCCRLLHVMLSYLARERGVRKC